jgi:hypothetical protein
MTIIHDMNTLPRLVGTALSERLRVMPVAKISRLDGKYFEYLA